jgi:hypothetical protein
VWTSSMRPTTRSLFERAARSRRVRLAMVVKNGGWNF